ncbi:MAG: NigD-like C-terminal domain-containing protein [Bacteroidales bacterium]
MNQVKQILLIVIAAVGLIACDDSSYATDFQYNMVTFISNEGGMSYEYQGYEDSPVIQLYDSEVISLLEDSGERIMLQYTELGVVNGVQQISTIGYSSVINDVLRESDMETINKVDISPMVLNSIWRTGNYININCQLLYTGAVRQFQLVMDKATASDEIVECYLIDNTMSVTTYYYRKAFAAFNVEAIWTSATCQTLRIYIVEKDNGQQYYDFTKTN